MRLRHATIQDLAYVLSMLFSGAWDIALGAQPPHCALATEAIQTAERRVRKNLPKEPILIYGSDKTTPLKVGDAASCIDPKRVGLSPDGRRTIPRTPGRIVRVRVDKKGKQHIYFQELVEEPRNRRPVLYGETRKLTPEEVDSLRKSDSATDLVSRAERRLAEIRAANMPSKKGPFIEVQIYGEKDPQKIYEGAYVNVLKRINNRQEALEEVEQLAAMEKERGLPPFTASALPLEDDLIETVEDVSREVISKGRIKAIHRDPQTGEITRVEFDELSTTITESWGNRTVRHSARTRDLKPHEYELLRVNEDPEFPRKYASASRSPR